MRQTLRLAIHHRVKSRYTFTALFVAALLGCAPGLPDGHASSNSGPRATRTGAIVNSAAQGLKIDGHTGAHYPRINGGKARVGKMQDVMASDYLIVIHEVDAVLFGDGSV